MKKHAARTSEHVNPNLIPMIDIMFLLLLFFMLGADMGHRELEEVRLPKADQATKDRENEREGRLTINAHHDDRITCATYDSSRVCRVDDHWKIVFRGEDCTKPEQLASALARTSEPGKDRKVMIRADAGAPFGLPQRAMNVCAKEGIFKVSVGAALPPQTR